MDSGGGCPASSSDRRSHIDARAAFAPLGLPDASTGGPSDFAFAISERPVSLMPAAIFPPKRAVEWSSCPAEPRQRYGQHRHDSGRVERRVREHAHAEPTCSLFQRRQNDPEEKEPGQLNALEMDEREP